MNSIFIGPWIGEFGHELFMWQAYVRQFCASHEFKKVIVICRENSKYLYEDFADEFIFFTPDKEGLGYPCCFWGFKKEGGKVFVNEKLLRKIVEKSKFKNELDNADYIIPTWQIEMKKSLTSAKGLSSSGTLHKHLGKDSQDCEGFDIILHGRKRDIADGRNWPENKWDSLFEKLNKKDISIASIGTREESRHISGSQDLRDMGLKQLCCTLRKSSLIVGASSGPMHLASLCECPALVWAFEPSEELYKTKWNPFKTEVLVLSKHKWKPSEQYVYENLISMGKVAIL